MNKPLLLTAGLAAIILGATVAQAQVINFDVPGSYSGQGALSDSGNNYWNPIALNGTTTGGLLSDGVAPSAITLTTPNLNTYAGNNFGGATGPELLFTPFVYSGSSYTLTLNNVPAGTYNLYLYGMNGSGGGGSTKFTVGGISVTNIYNADATTFIQGTDYGVISNIVLASAGTITIGAAATGLGSGQPNEVDFNGLQLATVVFSPSIGLQPASASLVVGQSTQLVAPAFGAPPLAYQWQKGTNGVYINSTDTGDVSGSMTNILNFSGLTASDAADYRLIVTNTYGAATSQVASVTVILSPRVSVQPLPVTGVFGQSVQLTATALGALPLAYQWQKGTNGVYINSTDTGDVSGSTTNVLNFSAATAPDASDYRLIVTNVYGATTSQVATVTVALSPSISVQPTSATLVTNQSFQLVAVAFGAPPLFYQWQQGTNGVYVNCANMGDISGSTTNILNFSAAAMLDAADYRLIVTNAFGAATSQVATVTVFIPSSDNSIRMGLSYNYVTNFSDWEDAFLAGNGKMGIMVFGNPLNDTIIYNDRGFNWAASTNAPFRTFAQVSAADLATIKSNCVAGNYSAADNLAGSAPQWNDGGESSRHPGYEMLISIPQNGTISNYSRVCNFRTGEVSVNWSDNMGNWTRKSFVSRKDNVIVQYLPAPSNGTITCSIQLTTNPGMGFPSGMTFTSLANANYLDMRVNYPANTSDAGYEGVTRVVPTGGTVSVNGSVVTISNATSVILLTRTAKYYTNCESQWGQQLLQSQLATISTNYNILLNGQLATHEAIYDRVKIDLGASASDRALPNETLLTMQTNSLTPVNAMWERAFDAGRYYFLSSSSSNTPPDLFGLWTGVYGPFGGANSMGYTLDANLNLQIAGGNIGDMPEAMAGYFAINEGWQKDFETNATKLLGCRGMLACGNTPGTTSGLEATMNSTYPYQYVTGEEPWLLYPLWEHYLITGDTNFLQNQLYPLLKDMGHFYEDFLTQTDTNGSYIFAGSISPENQPSNLPANTGLVNNSTFDVAGAKFALTTLIQTCNTLGLDQGAGQGVQTWSNILNRLPPYLIGGPNNPDGALCEWSWPGLSDNYNHRHSSHLVTVWPYGEITPETTASLFNAAAITLAKKDAYSYENTGHGLLHSALIAAGLKDALAVNHKILRLTKEGFYYNSLCSSHYTSHGTFCTDTCNSMPGVMMEMLVSSSPGTLELLPALPQTLTQGSITDVKGRNRVTVQNLNWNMANNSVDCTLQSDINQGITLIERSGINTISTSAPVTPSPLGQIARVIQLQAGVSTSITIGLGQTNLALNRPVTASSGTNTASGAVDGNNTTTWSSANTQNEWIYVDLGSVMNLNGAQLIWGSAYGQSYNIQVSSDAVNWTNVYETPNGLGGTDRITFAANGRYVRMLGVQSGTSGYSLAEFQVFGSSPTPVPVITTPPVGWTNSMGNTAVFTVVATDGGAPPLTYQWQFNGTNLTDGVNIYGATTAALTLSNVTVTNAGSYTVIVSNADASISTLPVYLQAVFVALSIGSRNGGALIDPTIHAFSSYYNGGGYVRNVTNLVQNNFVVGESGLTGPGYYTDTHDNGEDDVWHHASGDNNPYVTFDLGASYNLLITRIWNLNQGQGSDVQNGAKDVRISTSGDGVVFATIATNTLAEGTGTTNECCQDFPTLASSIQYVKLEPLDGYGGGWNGLGAVRFVVASSRAPPLISAILQGAPGFHYQIQYKSMLDGTTNWPVLCDFPTLISSTLNYPVFDGLVLGNPGQQFYRAIWLP